MRSQGGLTTSKVDFSWLIVSVKPWVSVFFVAYSEAQTNFLVPITGFISPNFVRLSLFIRKILFYNRTKFAGFMSQWASLWAAKDFWISNSCFFIFFILASFGNFFDLIISSRVSPPCINSYLSLSLNWESISRKKRGFFSNYSAETFTPRLRSLVCTSFLSDYYFDRRDSSIILLNPYCILFIYAGSMFNGSMAEIVQ